MTTTSTTASPNQLQVIGDLIKSDALIAFGADLITLIQGLASAGTDPFKVAAALSAFRGKLLGDAIGLENTVAQQFNGALTARLQAAISGAQKAQAADMAALNPPAAS